MAKVLVTESYLEDIGDAIRAKLETQDTYTPSEMATAIGQIGGGATLITKNITENGTYDASDDNADGYSSVVVDVAGGGDLYPLWTEIYNEELPSGYSLYGTPYLRGPLQAPSWVDSASQNIKNLVSNKCRISTRTSGSVNTKDVEITKLVAQQSIQELIQTGIYEGLVEYYGCVYGSSLITDYNLVLLGDFSQGGATNDNVLNDSIMNYGAVILQGIYQKQRASGYNTTMIYLPELNALKWTGMKDRNGSYDCYVTFTDNTHVSLSGNKQVMIYGIV